MFAPPIKAQQAKAGSQANPAHASKSPQDGRSGPGLGSAKLILELQRTIGNQAVLSLMAKRSLNLAGSTPADRQTHARHAERSVGSSSRHIIVGAVDDPLEREADRVADQVTRASAPTVSNPDTRPQISRKCAACEKALGETPASVDEVLRSPGQPLDAATRGYFEPLFGRDFSQVRVHTDAVANQSALDVNAYAYTIGHNVAFSPGWFAPGTHEGRRLLAHELTHVVQQSQSDGTRGANALQRKATEVPIPFIGGGLGFGGYFQDDSSVTFTPYATIGVFPLIWSYTDFPAGTSGDVQINAGTKTVARISMKMHILEDNVWKNETLDQEFEVQWDVTAAADGKLTIDPNARQLVGSPSSDTVKAALTSINPVSGADYVRISPIVSSAGGAGSVSPFGIGYTQNVPGQFVTRPFTLNIHVQGILSPTGKVSIGPISTLRTHDVLFPPPRNRIGQDAVSSSQERELISWYQGLTSQTREQIEAGLLPVTLEGHASPTGEEPMNLDLSDRRMQNVKKILGQFVGNRAVFHTRAIGRYLTTTPPGVESQEDRTVTISVWDQTFEGEAGWKDIKP